MVSDKIWSIRTKYFHLNKKDQMLQNAASDQGLHHLPLIHNLLDISTGGEIELFKF